MTQTLVQTPLGVQGGTLANYTPFIIEVLAIVLVAVIVAVLIIYKSPEPKEEETKGKKNVKH
jgi:hypothetical protein